MSMEKEIQEAIRKHMPTQVGEELQKLLRERDVLKSENEVLRRRLDDSSALVVELDDKRIALERKLAESGELEKREREISKKEIGFELTVMKIRLEEAEKRGDAITNLVQVLFRNPTKVRRITGLEPA